MSAQAPTANPRFFYGWMGVGRDNLDGVYLLHSP